MLATVIAGFSVILGAQHLSYANFEGKISCLRQYMAYMRVPPALRQRDPCRQSGDAAARDLGGPLHAERPRRRGEGTSAP